MKIDLNSDLGESFGAWRMGNDLEMLEVVSSANIACGFHAGDPRSILDTLRSAAHAGVSVGAHVSYPDLVGFGRRPMEIESDDLAADVSYQIGALQALAKIAGTKVSYVKPHGALYNTIAYNEVQAAAVIQGVISMSSDLPIVCLAGSPIVDQILASDLRAVQEVFADRSYEPDGKLTQRTSAAAVLHDPEVVADRMLELAQNQRIVARDGTELELQAESICVHGDNPGAVQIARALRQRLLGAGIKIQPFMVGQ